MDDGIQEDPAADEPVVKKVKVHMSQVRAEQDEDKDKKSKKRKRYAHKSHPRPEPNKIAHWMIAVSAVGLKLYFMELDGSETAQYLKHQTLELLNMLSGVSDIDAMKACWAISRVQYHTHEWNPVDETKTVHDLFVPSRSYEGRKGGVAFQVLYMHRCQKELPTKA